MVSVGVRWGPLGRPETFWAQNRKGKGHRNQGRVTRQPVPRSTLHMNVDSLQQPQPPVDPVSVSSLDPFLGEESSVLSCTQESTRPPDRVSEQKRAAVLRSGHGTVNGKTHKIGFPTPEGVGCRLNACGFDSHQASVWSPPVLQHGCSIPEMPQYRNLVTTAIGAQTLL